MNSDFKKKHLALLLCLLAVAAWFSPWWIAGKNLAPLDLAHTMMSPWRDGNEGTWPKNHNVADGVDQYLVYRMVAEKSYRGEGWVGWSTLTYGGTAQYANTMALYFDWTMQLHRWFPFWTAWHLGLMGQVMLAAAGMFLFLRGRSIGLVWACCGALAYAANSQFVAWIYHRWALGSFCWLPWILWAIDRHRQGKRFAWTLVPPFIALAFLGGTLQHGALIVLAVVCMWAEEAWRAGKSLPLQSQTLGRYAAWGVLGAGLAAMMILPCVDALAVSNNLGLHTGMFQGEGSVYPKGILQPLFNLAAYPLQVFPSVLGRCDSVDVLKGFRSELFYIAYFGSLPVLVAFLGIWKKETPPLARFLIIAGLLLPLTPLVRLLYQRLFLLFIFGGIFAFAHFMQNAGRNQRIRLFKITSVIAGSGMMVWTLLSIVLALRPGLTGGFREKLIAAGLNSSFGFYQDWIALRVDRFLGDLFIWSPQQAIPLACLVIALAGLRFTASLSSKHRSIGSGLMALALVAELAVFASRWVAWSDPVTQPLFPKTEETAALGEFVGKDGRVSTAGHPVSHMANTPFLPNTLSAYGIASIDGYDSVVPDGMVIPGRFPPDFPGLARFGVTHLSTFAGNTNVDPSWKPVWKGRMMDLYEAEQKLPRAVGFRTEEDLERFFGGEGFSGISVTETTGKENTRLLHIPAGVEWIRLAENHGRGWKYRIGNESEWRDVERAEDASMVMENFSSAETTELSMRYDPPLRKAGFAISGASLLLLLGLSFVMKPCGTNNGRSPD